MKKFMKLKDMFKKPIDRDIRGVIKVGQKEEENIRQELEEYVVTNELQKHFRDFFSVYSKGISGNTDDMGVWISGFFGSGKSHLLKILSYLLSDREINGKKAIDYFLEDNKIKDEMVIADMKRACQTSTDSILFNIDSKSDSAGNKGKDDILKVFLKVFNEMQGFSPIPHLADLERELAENNKYEEFKEKFREINQKEWIEERHKFNFIRTKVVKALEEIGFMNEVEAKDWLEISKKDYSISIENFSKMVNKYIKAKGNNHHVVFFVDEIGQYIGENTDLMLNLQTVTEDLGIHCKGKAWVVVTSQQAIDSITKVKGNDFSKIQGRFKTRISLTSTDVSEVIKKRILDKNEYANTELSMVYDEKESIIKNLILFDDNAEKKMYENKLDFQEVYPFIPYQFQILSHVLTSIREYGASGKHLSEGERSMLAMFKEGAEKYKNNETGVLVSFDKFYDGLQNFLDHSHSIVITRAIENGYINPDKEENCFNVNVLKVLFMIKYVKEIKGTLENITTLMVENIDEDRIVLKEKVQEALNILIKQTLVQKSGETYIFLTNEEQEVEKIIDKIDVDTNEILKKISEKVFDNFYAEKKYQYPKFKDYNFFFNQKVDDVTKGNTLYDIGINVITPNSDYSGNESLLMMKSSQEKSVFIDLRENSSYINEIEMDIKIEKFLKSGELEGLPQGSVIKEKKTLERKEHLENSNLLIEEALRNAQYYVNGNKVNINAKDYKSKINEALGKLVNIVYSKLEYITKPMNEENIREIFAEKENTLTTAVTVKHNENAITEIVNHVHMIKEQGRKITLKEIKNKFSKAPFGWNDKDIEWIVAKAFKDGEIELKKNGNNLTLLSESSQEIIDNITKKDNSERLYLEIKEKIDERSIKVMYDVANTLFDKNLDISDTDKMIQEFRRLSNDKITEIENFLKECLSSKNYPGKNILENGKKLLRKVLGLKDTKEIFNEILGHKDEYYDFSEDFEPIEKFFEGEQKNIWDESVKLYKKYTNSKNYFTNDELEKIAKDINNILNNNNPYNKIKDLNELNRKFNESYNKILAEKRVPVINSVNETREIALNGIAYTENTELKEKYTKKINEEFGEILVNVEKSENIKEIDSYTNEASNLKSKLLNSFDKQEAETIKIKLEMEKKTRQNPGSLEEIKIKKPKRIGISEINKDRVWEVRNTDDINSYLDKLKKRLEEELEVSEIVQVEF
jgi:hypothetical protein